MSRYRAQVAAALQAVSIRSDTRYAWLGRASRPLPDEVHAELDEAERRSYLVACLREELYYSFYCRGSPVPARWGVPEAVAADPWLLRALSEANSSRDGWDHGWTVDRLEGGETVVTGARLRARVATTDCRACDGPLRPGASVSVRVPKELTALSPGFYTAVGDAKSGAPDPDAIVRVYWSVTRASAPLLVRGLTQRLDAERIPFRLKVADHPSRLDRCDAAVLYVPHETFGSLRLGLRDLAAELSPRLRPRVPAFTLELTPGVGLAEDDVAGDSFGGSRCALLAEGIVRAHERGSARALDTVAGCFAEAGVELDAPYREPSLAGRHVL